MRTILLFLLFLNALTLSAQKPVQYKISFPNAVHHEAEVELLIPDVPAGPLTFRMSRSSPGRYATHEFGKNIYNVKAYNGSGSLLEVQQTEGDVYRVDKHDGTVRITYTIFGNWVDGTYMAIDETHAHLNMPATFMWIPALKERPIQIKFNDLNRNNWKVATQLKSTDNPNTFTAPDLNYFMDSPVELSNHHLVSWKDRNTDNAEQIIRLSSHSSDNKEVISDYAKMVERMVKEAKAVFGELPKFDYGIYTFLQDVNTGNAGDGMEHRNSTIITDTQPGIAGNELDLLGTFSHEFFHAWNVERIRPKTLEPFNFSHANMSSELWFAEGFTQYYGNLILKRAGFLTEKQYQDILSGILNGVINSPGAASFSATQMSRRAVFVDAGVSVDRNNYANTFTSYYTYGAFIAMGLDLRLRSEFNLTLDNYMQALWKSHGKPEIPYTIQDLQNVLSGLTNTAFAEDFFRRYIHGIEKNDYVKLLANAGLELRKANPGMASIGNLRLNINPADGRYRVTSATLKGTAAYEAGIDLGDYILEAGDQKLSDSVKLNDILKKYKPGQNISIVFESKGQIKKSTLTLKESETLELVDLTNKNQKQIEFRNSWLSSKIK
jgi:predicted metalloprotease with PDZ domain